MKFFAAFVISVTVFTAWQVGLINWLSGGRLGSEVGPYFLFLSWRRCWQVIACRRVREDEEGYDDEKVMWVARFGRATYALIPIVFVAWIMYLIFAAFVALWKRAEPAINTEVELEELPFMEALEDQSYLGGFWRKRVVEPLRRRRAAHPREEVPAGDGEEMLRPPTPITPKVVEVKEQ